MMLFKNAERVRVLEDVLYLEHVQVLTLRRELERVKKELAAIQALFT